MVETESSKFTHYYLNFHFFIFKANTVFLQLNFKKHQNLILRNIYFMTTDKKKLNFFFFLSQFFQQQQERFCSC